MKVFITSTHNCSRRNLDNRKIEYYFSANDCSLTNIPDEADIIVVSTCASHQKQSLASRNALLKYGSYRKKMLVLGCFAVINEQLFRSVQTDNMITVLPKNLRGIGTHFPSFKIKFSEIADAVEFDCGKMLDRDTSFLRISNGCLGNCAYCNIKKAIGRHTSKSLTEIDRDVQKIKSKGLKSISIIADDTGAYGADSGTIFVALLRHLLSIIDDDQFIKIGAMNPNWLIKYFDDLLPLLKCDQVHHISLAVESGSDRILKAMNRNYKRDDLISVLQQLREGATQLKIYGVFIIGFPTETNENFNQTLDLIYRGFFDIIDFHKYFETENMLSHKLMPKVDPGVIEDRCERAVEAFKDAKVYKTGG